MGIEKTHILSVFLWFALALVQSDTSASAVAVTVPQVPDNPIVDSLARSISSRLQNSRVLGPLSTFVIYNPTEEFFEIDTRILAESGVYDPSLTKLVVDAVREVGAMSSELFFDSIGYNMARLFFIRGRARTDNVEPLAQSIVNAIEVAACVDGVYDAKSVHAAVANGMHDKLKVYGGNQYDDGAFLFKNFPVEIKRLAGIQ